MAKNDGLDQVLNSLSGDEFEAYREVFNVSDDEYNAAPNKAFFFNKKIRETYVHFFSRPFKDEYSPDYKEIVEGTAKKLKISFDGLDEEKIEEKILKRVLEITKENIIKEKGQDAWDDIEKEAEMKFREQVERGEIKGINVADLANLRGPALFAAILAGRFAGFGLYMFANQIFFAVARFFGLSIGVAVAGPIIGRVLAMLLGPFGWAIAAIMVAYDLGKTNWKKIIPIVVLTATYRKMKLE